jgi:hypothetical protein
MVRAATSTKSLRMISLKGALLRWFVYNLGREKYSRTVCTLRFFVPFRLALHPLIEIVNGL